jgi:hypothetical protein
MAARDALNIVVLVQAQTIQLHLRMAQRTVRGPSKARVGSSNLSTETYALVAQW